jgi:CRISPR-associated protein Cas1
VGTDDGEPLQVGLVAHHVFCPRRAWLEAAGEKSDTAQLAIGERDSEPSDDPSRSRSVRIRALDVASKQLGLVGRADSVEQQEDGTLVIVEHKATPVRRSTTVTEATRVQLALLGLCLEEMGYSISGYAVWFSTHRTSRRRRGSRAGARRRQSGAQGHALHSGLSAGAAAS